MNGGVQSAAERHAAESQSEAPDECRFLALVRDERARSGVRRPRPEGRGAGQGPASGRQRGTQRPLVPTGAKFTDAHIGFFALSEVDCVWYGATVITTPESAAFDRGVRPVLRIVLPDKTEAVLNYRADPELQRRIDDLAAKSTEGQLTEEERAEYEGYVAAATISTTWLWLALTVIFTKAQTSRGSIPKLVGSPSCFIRDTSVGTITLSGAASMLSARRPSEGRRFASST